MTIHPNRTDRRTFKLRRPDGVIIERHVVDGKYLADLPGYTMAPSEAVSVREQVEALGAGEIARRLAVLHAGLNLSAVDAVAKLTTLVEDGAAQL